MNERVQQQEESLRSPDSMFSHSKCSLIFPALLIIAAALRGIGTLVVKEAVERLGFALVVGLRFLLAALLLAAISMIRRKQAPSGKVLLRGVVLGIVAAGVYLTNHAGMAFVSASQSAFLTSTYCAIVPLVSWAFYGTHPRPRELLAATACLAGVWFLFGSAERAEFTTGALLSLAGAALFACQVVLSTRLFKEDDPVVLTSIQMGVIGVVGMAVSIAQEGPAALLGTANPGNALLIGAVAVGVTLVPFLFQNVGLAYVPPEQGAILLSTEMLFCAAASLLLGAETLGASALTGFALITAGVFISTRRSPHKEPFVT